jgi:hypothetical protein
MKDLTTALSITEQITNVEVLLYKPARIRIGFEKDKTGQFDDKNKVMRIMPLDAPAPTKQTIIPPTKPVAAKPAKSAAAGAAPWKS